MSGNANKMTVRLTYVLTVDGYTEHPEGEIILILEDWTRLKEYHVALGREYISVNASGGSLENALQILASKGARFTQTVPPAHSAFINEDD